MKVIWVLASRYPSLETHGGRGTWPLLVTPWIKEGIGIMSAGPWNSCWQPAKSFPSFLWFWQTGLLIPKDSLEGCKTSWKQAAGSISVAISGWCYITVAGEEMRATFRDYSQESKGESKQTTRGARQHGNVWIRRRTEEIKVFSLYQPWNRSRMMREYRRSGLETETGFLKILNVYAA